MRHFEVDYKWSKKYTSEEFRIACEEYDQSDIKNSHSKVKDDFKDAIVYISKLKRSRATLELMNLDNDILETGLINEVTMSPFINTRLKLPLKLWLIVGRLQWLLNIKRQTETRFDTTQKIKKLLALINNEQRDILIIGHGFYFSYLKRFLKKEFSGKNKSVYNNGEIIRLEKISSHSR